MAVTIIDQQISDLLIQVGQQITANGQNQITGPKLKDILDKIINLLNKKIGDLSVVGIQGLETVADILAFMRTNSQGGGLTTAYNTFYRLNSDGSIPSHIPLGSTVYDPTDKRIKQRTSQGLVNPSVPSTSILYVESQFKELYYWSGTDMISIAAALSLDNKFMYIKQFSNTYPTNDQVALMINNLAGFAVANDRILIIKVMYGDDKYNPTSYVFTLKGLGAGNYGQGGVQVNTSQVELLALSAVTPQDIEALQTTQLVDLGEIGFQAIEDAFNTDDMDYNIQDQALGYVLVKAQRDGEQQYYIFTGPGGSYGNSGSLTATADQFFLFERSFGEGSKFEYEWDGTKIRIKNSNGTWGPWVDLGGQQGPVGTFNYEWNGTRLRIQNSDGTWGPYVDLRPDMASISDRSVLYFDYYKGSTPSNPQSNQVWYVESPGAQFQQYNGTQWAPLTLQSLNNMLFVYKTTKQLYYWNATTGFIEVLATGGGGGSSLRTEWEDVSLTPSTQIHIDMSTVHSHNLTPNMDAWNAVGQQPFFRGFVGDPGAMEDGVVGYIRNGSMTADIRLAHNDTSLGIPLFLSAQTKLTLRPQELVWWKYSQTRTRAEITSFATSQSLDNTDETDDIYTLTADQIIGDQVRLMLTYPPRGGTRFMSVYVNGQFITPTDLQINGKELRIIMSNIEFELSVGDLVVVRYRF